MEPLCTLNLLTKLLHCHERHFLAGGSMVLCYKNAREKRDKKYETLMSTPQTETTGANRKNAHKDFGPWRVEMGLRLWALLLLLPGGDGDRRCTAEEAERTRVAFRKAHNLSSKKFQTRTCRGMRDERWIPDSRQRQGNTKRVASFTRR
jgi:hypothetical protein